MKNNDTVILGTCALCGQVIEPGADYVMHKGEYICDDCEQTEYFECCDCGELHYMDDRAGDYDGDPLCNDCYENNYYWTCDYCGDIYADGDECISIDDGGEYVCNSCADRHYYHCDHCGDYFSDRNMRYYGGNMEICDNCSDYYAICEDCGDVFHIDNGSYSDRDDSWYCDYCYNSHNHGDDSDLIWSYSEKPDPVFHNTPGDMCGDEYRLYIGVENEISGYNAYIDDAAQEIRDIADTDLLYMKDDCSIHNGFEMVSHPCTLDYHMNKFPWDDIFDAATSNGFEMQHRSCGLHCHVNRRFFGSDREIQDLHIAKLILVVEKIWDDMTKFARRDHCDYSRKPCVKYERGDDAETLQQKYNESTYTRYYAVNVENEKTVEFRMFRNTLDYQTFVATLQFVDTICRYVKKMDISDIATVTMGHIIESAPETFTELREYCAERCIKTYAVETVSVAEIGESDTGAAIEEEIENNIEIPLWLRDLNYFYSAEYRRAHSTLLNMSQNELRAIAARNNTPNGIMWNRIIAELVSQVPEDTWILPETSAQTAYSAAV